MRQILALHPSLAHGGAFAGLGLPHLTAPDMIGHGQARDWDMLGDLHSLCTRDAIDLAAKMAATSGPIDLIGHSFGGTVALRIALERPELLRSIVLIEPVLFAAARADDAPEYRDFIAQHQAFEVMMRVGDLRGAAQHFQSIWGDGRDFGDAPKSVQRYIMDRLHLILAQTDALHNDSAGIMGYLRLEAVGLPVLLICGSDSPPIVAAIARALASRLPNLTQVTIQGARHMAPITHPRQVAAAMTAFWAQN
jgi:lipase